MIVSPLSLTHHQVNQMVRIAWLAAILCLFVGVLCMWVPLPVQTSPGDVVQATIRPYNSNALSFKSYSEFTSTRQSPFEFQELQVAQVPMRQRALEPPVQQATTPATPAPPPVMPETADLTLVGTVPSNVRASAIIRDDQSGETMIVNVDDPVRNAIVEEIRHNSIILRVAEQRSELMLTAIRGSEDLSNQLSGEVTQLQQQPQTTRSVGPRSTAGSQQPRSLGISGYVLGKEQQAEFGLNQPGLLITSVQAPDSSLQAGDVVLSIASRDISSTAEVRNTIDSLRGDSTTLRLFRDGSTIVVTVNLM